jgi:acetyl esterase/lipase
MRKQCSRTPSELSVTRRRLFALLRSLCAVPLVADLSQPARADLMNYQEIEQRLGALGQIPERIHYGPLEQQYGEIWLPAALGKHPTIILVHGGAWRGKDGARQTRLMAKDLRDRGFAVWNIEYRTLDDKAGFPSTFLDIGAAADHLGVVAKSYPLDLDRLVVVGHSAGGHLALWLAGRRRIRPESPLYRADAIEIKGVVDLAGPPDLRAGLAFCDLAGGKGTIAELIDAEKRGFNEAVKDTSPAELLPLGLPQALVFGIYDGIMPAYLGYLYRATAAARGEAVELILVPETGHMELIAPWTPAWSYCLRAIRLVFHRAEAKAERSRAVRRKR